MSTLKLDSLRVIIMHIKDVYHGRIKGSVTCILLCSIPKPEGLADVNCAGNTQLVEELGKRQHKWEHPVWNWEKWFKAMLTCKMNSASLHSYKLFFLLWKVFLPWLPYLFCRTTDSCFHSRKAQFYHLIWPSLYYRPFMFHLAILISSLNIFSSSYLKPIPLL